MSEKRRDNRNRVLRSGESQRPDGRYAFKYKDIHGNVKFVYSWRLDKNDRAPAGKRRELSLREKEKQIEQDLFNGLVSGGGAYTVLELAEKYISTKTGVRHSTRSGYQTVINFLKKDPMGGRRIDRVKISDAKIWLIQLQKKQGKSYSTIHTIRGVLRPAFRMAVEDDLLRKNPFDFELATVIVNDSVTRDAISREQERLFLKFVQETGFSLYITNYGGHTMKTLISCAYNMDNCCVELKFNDGSMIAIDTIAVENEIADNMYQRSELDYLIYNDPIGYADLILNGDSETYFKTVTECNSLDT